MKNKVAFITGASRGIGKAIAIALAKAECDVVLLARNESELDEVAHECSNFKVTALPISCDLTNEDELVLAINKAYLKYPKIDFVINNAGVGTFEPVEEVSTKTFDWIMDTNVRANFILYREFASRMKAEKAGHLLSIASDVSKRTFANGSIYCASKYAQDAFSNAVRKELRPFGIKVSVIYPGIVDTYFNNSKPGDEDYKNYLKPEDIAASVLHVLSAPKHVVIDELVIHPLTQEY